MSIPGLNQGLSPTAARRSDVREAVDEILSVTKALDELSNMLAQRLVTVVAQKDGERKQSQVRATRTTTLGQELDGVAGTLGDVRDRVAWLLSALEL